MAHNAVLDAVTDLRSSAFDLLEAAAHRDPSDGGVAETVDHLQVVANELGAVEELLRDQPPPGDLRRRRYFARATHGD